MNPRAVQRAMNDDPDFRTAVEEAETAIVDDVQAKYFDLALTAEAPVAERACRHILTRRRPLEWGDNAAAALKSAEEEEQRATNERLSRLLTEWAEENRAGDNAESAV